MSFPDLSASRPVQGRSFFSFRQVRRLLPAAAVMAVLLPAPPVLRAQTPAPMVQITVTAARLPLAVSDAVAEVTVLDRAAIERAEGLTLSQLLAQQAGFQLNSNGGLGKTSTLFIRGLEARHTLLLIDGVRVGSATVGTPSLDNLPLESIERIEIVRGPMSSLYGNGAMGGVVQLFTRRADTGVSGNAKLAVGSQGYGQAAAGLGFGDGRFDLAAQVQHTRTGGQNATNPSVPFGLYNADRDGWRQTGGSLRAGLQAGAGWRAELVALQATGTTDLDDGPAARAQAELTTRSTALTARGPVAGPWRTRVTFSEAVDGYNTLSSASAFATLGLIQTRSRNLAWENAVTTPIGEAQVLLERTTETVSRPGAAFTVSERDIDAAGLVLAGQRAGHTWQASLRRDRNSQFGGVTTGAVGYGYAVTPAWRVGGSLGTSQTLPSFNQLYFPGFGNPKLVPEEGEHVELHARWLMNTGEVGHSLRVSPFVHRYRNFINSGPRPTNEPRVRTEGVTLAYSGSWKGWVWSATVDYSDPRIQTEGATKDKLLVRHAQRAVKLALDWNDGPWSAGATLAGFSHRWENSANTVRLAGYATLDLRAEWALARDTRLGLVLLNAGDTVYSTALGYDQPRRQGQLVLRHAWR